MDIGMIGNLGTVTDLFKLTKMIPPYYLQVAIGIYIIEIIFILSATLVTVDAGEDKLRQKYETGKNLKRGILLYLVVSLLAILTLSVVAVVALGGLS